MNKFKKEKLTKRQEAMEGLNEEELETFLMVEKYQKQFHQMVNDLHHKIFPEEFDFMYDEISESKRRKRGENRLFEFEKTFIVILPFN